MANKTYDPPPDPAEVEKWLDPKTRPAKLAETMKLIDELAERGHGWIPPDEWMLGGEPKHFNEPLVWTCPVCGLVTPPSLDCSRCGPYAGKTLGDLEREHKAFRDGQAKPSPFAAVVDE